MINKVLFNKKYFKLEWHFFSDFQEALRKGFDDNYKLYVIFKENKTNFKREIVNIGMTTNSPSKRLLGSHKQLSKAIKSFPNDNIRFAFGIFIKNSSWEKEIKLEDIRDVEAALICYYIPKFNGQHLLEYNRSPIDINNECLLEESLNIKLTSVGSIIKEDNTKTLKFQIVQFK